MSVPFEQLEDRRLMAAQLAVLQPIAIISLFHPLTIDGTSGADNIYVYPDGAGNVCVSNNGALSTYTDPWISSVIVNANDGNDFVWGAPNLGHAMQIHGGRGADSLYGTDLNDSIDGGGETDYIYGRAGDDNVDGGVAGFANFWDNTGHDALYGCEGNDTINASDVGNCVLDGGDGNDYLYGWQGNDAIYGGPGDDEEHGSAGNDSLYGYSGNDRLWGEDGDDTLRGEFGNDALMGGNGNDTCYGDDGDDWIYGEAGNDKLYAGAGDDAVLGGAGNDVIVTIGGGQYDSVWGEAGTDSFWTDSEITERVNDLDGTEAAGGNLHRVSGFMTERFTNGTGSSAYWNYQTPSRELSGQNFRDPDGGSNYINVSSRPLFGNFGPTKNDIDQGGLNDCYFLATLSAIAKVNANRIRQSVVELGDGTYAVRFFSGGSERYLRVDADLPTDGMGNLSFAGPASNNSTWVSIMEKAWAHFRTNEGRWNSVDFGWMSETFSALNTSTNSLDLDWWYKLWNNSDNLWNYVCDRLSEGQAVTIGTHGSPSGLIAQHAYTVDYVYMSGTTRMVCLRNPHGAANDPAAYVHITASQLYDSISRVQSAYV